MSGTEMSAYGALPSDDMLAPFWAAAAAGDLVIQRCLDCGAERFPPASACDRCLGCNQGWTKVSGKATVESSARYHRAYWSEFADQVPYTVCLVRLAEGPLMISNFAAGEDDLPLGTEVEVTFEPGVDGRILPKFRRPNRAGRD